VKVMLARRWAPRCRSQTTLSLTLTLPWRWVAVSATPCWQRFAGQRRPTSDQPGVDLHEVGGRVDLGFDIGINQFLTANSWRT